MKKGFTLIELLGVIILLGLVGLIVIPSITKLIKDSRQDLYENQVRTIEESARKWGIQNTDLLELNTTTYINLTDLINSGYMEQDIIKDPRTNTDMNGCIAVSYSPTSNKYKYKYDDKACAEIDNSKNMTSTDPQYVCYNFDASTGTIVKYDVENINCLSNVDIPDKIDGVVVKHIGNAAFINGTGQKCYSNPDSEENDGVSVPYNYVRHDGDGYYGCYFSFDSESWNIFVTSVTFPKYLETIGTSAFVDHSITNLDFSNSPSLIRINDDAFYDNPIETINFTNVTKLESIGAWVISDTPLMNLDLRPLVSLKTISAFAFAWNNITNVNLQGLTNLTTIEYGAFEGNQMLEVTIPASVTYIGYHAFYKDESYNWDNVIILYNVINLETRFDGNWGNIGWPCALAPSGNVCG